MVLGVKKCQKRVRENLVYDTLVINVEYRLVCVCGRERERERERVR